jgi:hypothetical protein
MDKWEARVLDALLALREVEADAEARLDHSALAYLDVALCALQRLLEPDGEALQKFKAAGGALRFE